MKRALAIGVCLMVLAMLAACTPAPVEPDAEGVRAVSIVRLCEQTGRSVDEAKELLDLLEALGHTGEVLFAYGATDADKVDYDHIWIGASTVDVYCNAEGSVRAVLQNGVVLYGEMGDDPAVAEPADTDEPPSSEEPVTLTLSLDDMSEQVTAGSSAFVRVLGRAGESYRIKVYLKSGASTAKGLEDKTADVDGLVLWEWNVSSRTTPGDYRVVIVRVSDERDTLELPFTVLPKDEN